ncbi:MAG: tetratricopeptide repeat protein [Rikenellaceae bacterium]
MRRLLSILSLMVLFLAGFLPSKGASYVLRSGKESYEREKYNDSLPIRRGVELTTDGQKRVEIYKDLTAGDSLYRLSIKEDSTYAPAYYHLSQLLATRRVAADSVLYYAEQAYRLDSLNKWYSDSYAQFLAINGDFDKALVLYKRAIEREPQNLNGYIVAAMLYNQKRETEEALATLDSAEVRTGKSAYLSSIKRELLLATNQQERAIEEARELTVLDPEDVESRMVLAQLYLATKQDSLALIEYEAALAIDTTSTAILGSIAQFHAERDNFAAYFSTISKIYRLEEESLDNKITTFERITSDRRFYGRNLLFINTLATQLYSMYPTEKRVVELYADHLIASGELDQALELYKKHVDDEPAQYDYYKTIIDIESYKERVDSVELYATRAIELFAERHELRLSMANLYSYTKRFDEAIESFKQALEMVPTDSLRGSIQGYIGDMYHQKSLLENKKSRKKAQMRRAYSSYDKSLELYPTNPLVLNNYAYFLSLEKRDLGKALDMSGRAIALAEGNSTYLDTYAWVLYELGRYEEAKKIMRQVIALDTTESAEIQFHYGEILAALGEEFMAEVYYDKALKLGYDASIIEEKKSQLK